jgi:hypothetical protein
MSPRALYLRYQTNGMVPFIFRDHGITVNVQGFNHIDYAKRRANEVCNDSTVIPRP